MAAALICTSASALTLSAQTAPAIDDSAAKLANAICIADISSWADEGFTFYCWLTMSKVLYLHRTLHFFAYDDDSRSVESLSDFDTDFYRSECDPVLGCALGGLPN